MRLETLPNDLVTHLKYFLLGHDLFSLSHVNSKLLTELLAPDSDFWKKRVPQADPASLKSAKQRYCTSRSYRLLGPAEDAEGVDRRGSAITLPLIVHQICGHLSFTVSLWFAVEDPTGSRIGGTLLGAQSFKFSTNSQTPQCQQFINVDPEGNLYCTMIYARRIVATKLQPGRWYHVALTFNQSQDPRSRYGSQCVYLDGQVVDENPGRRVDKWFYMNHWQLGNGCLGSHTEWDGFRGLIDDFSVRRRVLSPEEIQQMVKHGEPREPRQNDKVVWSLHQDEMAAPYHGEVMRVKCSRPRELCMGGSLTGPRMPTGWSGYYSYRAKARPVHAAP